MTWKPLAGVEQIIDYDVTSISIRGLSSHSGDASQLYMVTTLRRFWNINGHLAVHQQELSKIKHGIGIDRIELYQVRYIYFRLELLRWKLSYEIYIRDIED
jgi:hypothetical protein